MKTGSKRRSCFLPFLLFLILNTGWNDLYRVRYRTCGSWLRTDEVFTLDLLEKVLSGATKEAETYSLHFSSSTRLTGQELFKPQLQEAGGLLL
ncbi:hypothetical protein DC20_14515 [Rufibacter tibetensis]|uniref:Uncharacterized protein n=1 Tax=Rufibacter tibetensis TaxID=512763 RepID=A0A0P0CYY6_9BACT|nr:hypothetical protein DC20_14515 [Rufibacter tibetensis]